MFNHLLGNNIFWFQMLKMWDFAAFLSHIIVNKTFGTFTTKKSKSCCLQVYVLFMCVCCIQVHTGCSLQALVDVSQLFSGGRQVFGELSEAEVGTIDHICLAAALGRTHWLTVTLVAQTPVFSTWRQAQEGIRIGGNNLTDLFVETFLKSTSFQAIGR